MDRVGATAPGKLMVSGEYAVLEGAPAVVFAVQTRALVRWVDAPSANTASPERYPEAHAARRFAEEQCGAVHGELEVDVRALRMEGIKLGVGSSAAAAAAAAHAVFASHGRLVAEPVLRAAFDGHRAVSPSGSGADVAASVLGGTVMFRRPKGVADPSYEVRALEPPNVRVAVAWTGQAASTHRLIQKVHALRDRDLPTYRAAMDRLSREAEAFVEALGEGGPAVVAAAARYGDAMGALGDAAEAPIVEEKLRRVAILAREAGGAAKPSGAGGGDVALAFFSEGAHLDAFQRACAAADIRVLDLELGGLGVLSEPR